MEGTPSFLLEIKNGDVGRGQDFVFGTQTHPSPRRWFRQDFLFDQIWWEQGKFDEEKPRNLFFVGYL